VTNNFAILTPSGRGAIATVGIRGPAARELVSRCFRPASGRPLTEFGPGRIVFGTFHGCGSVPGAADEANEPAEELVVGVLAANDVEVHCHGGIAAVAAICQALAAAGGQQIDASGWARESEPDPIAAAAALQLAEARTARTAQILLDQYRGALRSAIEQARRLLQEGHTAEATSLLQSLIDRSDVGLHLTSPWRVVLVGRPNVGKSSLINRLVGYERAIVYDQPGTTRDVLSAATALAGWPIVLSDTAGLRVASDDLEAAGIERARAQLAAADLVLFVGDAAAPWTAADDEVWSAACSAGSTRPPLVIHNKSDLRPPPDDGRPTGLAVSAASGAGIDELIAAIVERLVPEPPPPGAAVPFNAQQLQVISLAKSHPNAGAAHLGQLLGRPEPSSQVGP
jgi:tRNA modification GTPase